MKEILLSAFAFPSKAQPLLIPFSWHPAKAWARFGYQEDISHRFLFLSSEFVVDRKTAIAAVMEDVDEGRVQQPSALDHGINLRRLDGKLSLRAALPPPKLVRAAGAFGNPETVSKVFALVEVAPVSCKTCCIGERRFRPRACWVRPRPLHGRRIRLDRRFRPWRFLPIPALRLPFWRWRRHSDQRRNGHGQHQRTDGNQHRASGQLERLPGLSERAVWTGWEQRPDRHDRDRAGLEPCGRLRNARDGWHGRRVHVLLHGGPLRERKCDRLIAAPGWQSRVPNLHASAAGSTLGGPGRGISTSSAGSDAFSDLVSITEAQIDAVDKQIGSNLGAIWVKLSYLVSGAVAAKNGSAGADFFVSDTVAAPGPADSKGGAASVTASGLTDNLLGHTFVVEFQISPEGSVLLQGTLTPLAPPPRRSPAFPAPNRPICRTRPSFSACRSAPMRPRRSRFRTSSSARR